VLIFAGLPAAVANGSNRVALLGQNLVAIANFRRKGFHDLGLGLRLSVPALLGAASGSLIAVRIPGELFKQILAGVMVLVLAGIVMKGRKTASAEPPQAEQLRRPSLQLGLFFVIGAYGGFIQAGVGYLLIFALSVVGGLSLVRTNSIKVIVVGAYMVVSLAVFIIEGKVAWLPAAALTLGNSLGGYLGSAFSISKGDAWIKAVLVVAVLGMAGRLAGLY
jgi:hypothetical protein